MYSLIAHRSEKISESKRSSIFKLARNLHFSVGSSFILQFYAEIRNFPHEKSIRNCGRDETEMQSRSSRDIPSAKLEEVVRSAMVAFMRVDSASGCPGETGSPCAACTGVMAHAGSRFPSLASPSPVLYNGSLPHPFAHPPSSSSSSFFDTKTRGPRRPYDITYSYSSFHRKRANAHRVAAHETLS